MYVLHFILISICILDTALDGRRYQNYILTLTAEFRVILNYYYF